ncbi:MAG: aminotransferase class I/II-fold pyridoxal phosphate-dependent enzyme, partial [Bacteriovoracaceae bacterium]|nr:aminotransferase class I/II-fold pyridoxal phosphate-dependent enzyme [Bacteriovoracaceae bacterium]
GDSVLIPNPGYPAYSSVARLLDVNIVEYNLTENNGWLPDVSELKSLVKLNPRTKLMWLNYPHMPSGTSMNETSMKELVRFAKENDILICNDNPYGLILNETAPLSILSFDAERTHTCELNSLSKSFNMAGWRVGMLLGSKWIIDLVMKVKSQVDSGMFLPIQRAAIEALHLSHAWHKERNEIYRRRRKLVWEIFDELKISYKKDQVGLFVWGKIPNSVPNAEMYSDLILKEARVFLTPGFIFGTNGEKYLRASLCAPEERLTDANLRIKQGKFP